GAMAGLPGTGKSTLAARLAEGLGGVVLDKDRVRAALFPPPALDYSMAQDDLCMAAIYRAAAHLHTTAPGLAVILDGRTFLRASHLHDLLAWAASLSGRARISLARATCSGVGLRVASDSSFCRAASGTQSWKGTLACALTTAAATASATSRIFAYGARFSRWPRASMLLTSPLVPLARIPTNGGSRRSAPSSCWTRSANRAK